MRDFKTFFSMIGYLKYILDHKQKMQCVGILLIITVGAMFELLGVTAILPFIQSIMNPDILLKNRIINSIITIFGVNDTNGIILITAAGVVIVYIIKNLFLLFSAYEQSKFRNNLQKKLSVQLLDSFMKRPYTFFVNTNSSIIMRSIGGDVTGTNLILDSFFKLVVEALSCMLISIYIFVADTVMALGVLGVAAICFIMITLAFKKRTSSLGHEQFEACALQSRYSYQAIMGIKEIMVSKRNEHFVGKYENASEQVRKVGISYDTIKACPEKIIETVCVAGIIGMVCVRLKMGVDPATFVPQLGAFAIASFRILPSISRLSGYINTLVFYRPTLEATYANMVEARENESVSYSDGDLNGRELTFNKAIEIKNITWKYPNAINNVLDELSLTIQKGESIGLIGGSGAGKTTLADVLLGLLHPQKGAIYMDGMDVLAMSDAWSRIVGYVPQTVFLIDDSVKNNIAFGIDPEKIDEHKVWNALEQAQLKEFIESLPEGLNSQVGERGVKFSGGQRQRIAIARALYSDPEVLILDEATAALDNETENSVMEAIDILQGHKTLIIVAHRLTTIRNCDKVYEIVNGKANLKDKEAIFSS